MVSTEIRLVLCAAENGEKSTQSTKTRPGANCGSDHEFLIAKSDVKKVGKTTRPFSYDRNQIPYNYTVDGSDKQIQGIKCDRVPEELRMEVCNTVQKMVIKTIPKRKKCKRAKWLSEEALQIDEKRREMKGKGENQSECRVPKNSRER